MKVFLKYVIPILSVAVLILCLWAACFEEKGSTVEFNMPMKGGIPTYFVAKGLFCSAALFLLGKLLEKQMERPG